MSYYEFEEENFNRITDSEWKGWVEYAHLPPRPFWTDSFLYSTTNVTVVFDTDAPINPYPSIAGTHNGTISPSQTITVQKLYTYPSPAPADTQNTQDSGTRL
ncbi:MAG: hypothetical protein C5S38_09725 [Candidatus Methanophagaceae archaeon]|nr:MAG: hypothetical protein C5S38_09725 [Methanophagales archaeon]